MLSVFQLIILPCVETGTFLSDFAEQLRLKNKNVEVPDLYFTLLHVAGIRPTVVLK